MQKQNGDKTEGKSLMELFIGRDESQYDWKRTVDWTKVINSAIFALLLVALLTICAVSDMVHVVWGGG